MCLWSTHHPKKYSWESKKTHSAPAVPTFHLWFVAAAGVRLCGHCRGAALWPLQGCGFVTTPGLRFCGHCRGAAAIQWLLVLSLGNMSPWQPSTSFYLTPHPGAEMYFTPSQKDNCVSFVRKILSALGQHNDFPRPVAALTPTPGPAHVTEPRAS